MDWEHAHLAVLHAVEPIALNIYSCTRRPPSGTRACVARLNLARDRPTGRALAAATRPMTAIFRSTLEDGSRREQHAMQPAQLLGACQIRG
jgi:hypothetical protein